MRPSTLALATLCLFPTTALAQPAALDAPAMQVRMAEYFQGEVQQGYVFLGYGLGSLGAGAYLFAQGDQVSRGASYPVLTVGLLESVVGVTLALKTSGQIAERRARIASDPAGFARDERARMEAVMIRFTIVEYAEIAVVSAGVGLCIYGALRDEPTVEGVGAGMAAEGALLLGLDYLAAQRGGRYLDELKAFTPFAGRGALGLGWHARF